MILETVKDILAEYFDVCGEDIEADHRLEEFGADHVDCVCICLQLEEAFEMSEQELWLSAQNTVGDIVEYIEDVVGEE